MEIKNYPTDDDDVKYEYILDCTNCDYGFGIDNIWDIYGKDILHQCPICSTLHTLEMEESEGDLGFDDLFFYLERWIDDEK